MVVKPSGALVGVEAVIDKDLASALLADGLDADALLLLTDVDAVYRDWNKAAATAIRHLTPDCLDQIALPAGSMGPKVEAASAFVKSDSRFAAIGALADAVDLPNGDCGTGITAEAGV